MTIKKLLKRKNFILGAIICLLAAFCLPFLFHNDKGNTVRISYNNEVVDELSLNEEQIKEYNFNDGINIVEISGNEVKVSEANCDNQVCVNTKEVSEIGEVIACLPHKFIVEVV